MELSHQPKSYGHEPVGNRPPRIDVHRRSPCARCLDYSPCAYTRCGSCIKAQVSLFDGADSPGLRTRRDLHSMTSGAELLLSNQHLCRCVPRSNLMRLRITIGRILWTNTSAYHRQTYGLQTCRIRRLHICVISSPSPLGPFSLSFPTDGSCRFYQYAFATPYRWRRCKRIGLTCGWLPLSFAAKRAK